MKLISFVVPSYNSESYLHRAIDSLLPAKEDAEIIIVNDGSKDKTLEVAKVYQKKYPNIVKVIDKENGGHGSTINEGLSIATGLYFKVIDSDDWVDHDSLMKLLDTIKAHYNKNIDIDLYITNFVYEHIEDNTKFERDYSKNFPHEKVFGWNEIRKKFRRSNTLLMHSLTYKTKLLKDMKLELPNHTFYVDNLIAYLPLLYSKNLYYIKLPFYRYLIGRPDQSITFENITARYEQQIRVQKLMVDGHSYEELNSLPKKLGQYMKHNLGVMMLITQMFTSSVSTKKRKEDLNAVWQHIKEKDIKIYRMLRYRSVNVTVNFLPWRLKGQVMRKGYYIIANKIKLG